MKVMPVPSVKGMFANDLGQIKLPETEVKMPNGGFRKYKTKWRFGDRRKARKEARHEYYDIKCANKHHKVHRLVCEAFHGPAPSDKPIVIHINENALDNRPENLKWGTQKENLNMPSFIEYCKGRTGEESPRAKWLKKRLEA